MTQLVPIAIGTFAWHVPKAFGIIGSTPIFSTKFLKPLLGAFFMDFFVYILYSELADRYYIGQTDHPSKRLIAHNEGKSGFTSMVSDWKMVYLEKSTSRSEALRRELQIKRKKSRKYIEWLISK